MVVKRGCWGVRPGACRLGGSREETLSPLDFREGKGGPNGCGDLGLRSRTCYNEKGGPLPLRSLETNL